MSGQDVFSNFSDGHRLYDVWEAEEGGERCVFFHNDVAVPTSGRLVLSGVRAHEAVQSSRRKGPTATFAWSLAHTDPPFAAPPVDLTAESFRDPNPWLPMRRSIDLKHLGKFMEELGEASAAAARCLIQGIDEAEPVTGKVNRVWLEDEIADVIANAILCVRHWGLDWRRIEARVLRKIGHLSKWHGMLEEAE